MSKATWNNPTWTAIENFLTELGYDPTNIRSVKISGGSGKLTIEKKVLGAYDSAKDVLPFRYEVK